MNDYDQAARFAVKADPAGFLRWLLPWIPLMKGGGKPTMVEEWIRIADAEPDPRWRANYAALALVFAELTRHTGRWKKALEGWNVKESTAVAEWKAEARREDLINILVLRFPDLPGEWLARIKAQDDPKTLSRWIEIAATASLIWEFRASCEF